MLYQLSYTPRPECALSRNGGRAQGDCTIDPNIVVAAWLGPEP